MNLARVYLREGRLDEAAQALERAQRHPPPYPWTVAYLTAELNRQNGFLDEAIEGYRALVETRFNQARERGFDFRRDYRLLNELAGALFERSKIERGEARSGARETLLSEARDLFGQALEIDPENVEAHWGMAQVLARLGDGAGAERHRSLHGRYKTDDNARDRAIATARRADPAADHAAASVVIYDLRRSDAYGIEESFPRAAAN